jgi:hypothetical protein
MTTSAIKPRMTIAIRSLAILLQHELFKAAQAADAIILANPVTNELPQVLASLFLPPIEEPVPGAVLLEGDEVLAADVVHVAAGEHGAHCFGVGEC